MADQFRNLKRKNLTHESSESNLLPMQWAHFDDTKRLGAMRSDGLTVDHYYDSTYVDSVLAGAIGTLSESVVVENILNLRGITDPLVTSVFVKGYTTANDGGGGWFTWDEDSEDAEDYGLTFVPNSAPASGRWKRIFSDHVYLEGFGGKADNIDGNQTDNGPILQTALDATRVVGTKILLKGGDYGFNSGISLRTNNHIVGTRGSIFSFYGSTISDPYTAVTYDGINGDCNGGLENVRCIQRGEALSGMGLYLVGSIPAENGHNATRLINRDLYFLDFDEGIHIENVAYINAFYNIRVIRCKTGIYAKNAANAINFYGYYYDGGSSHGDKYGVRYASDDNPTYYTLALNFFGGAIENCEHSLYTTQNVTFTSQFFGTYFEAGDIELQSGHVTMVGCNTRHSSDNHHVNISGSCVLELYGHTFGGSLNGSDPDSALVKVSGGASYIEHGRTLHSAMLGLTGRTNPKINITGTGVYARYWALDPSTGGEEGIIREFGSSQRYRDTASDACFVASNLADGQTSSMASNKITSPTFERSLSDIFTASLHKFIADTIDGSDNKRLFLSGGGDAGTGRGGSIVLSGNEATNPGKIALQPGDISGGIIDCLIRDNQAGAFSVNQAGDNYIGIDTTNAAEAMRFGNTGLNPSYTFLGTGLLATNGNSIKVTTAKTPSSATDTGVAGQICWDANYIYVCTATNTWKRSAISTW